MTKDIENQISKAKYLHDIRWIWRPVVGPRLLKHFEKVVMTADLLGRALVWRERKEQVQLDTATFAEDTPTAVIDLDGATELIGLVPMNKSEAWRFFKNKIPMTRTAFDAQSLRWHDEAFVISGYMNDHIQESVVRKIKAEVEEAIDAGKTMQTWKPKVNEIMEKAGFLGFGTLAKEPAWYLETVYLTNVHSALNAARWAEQTNTDAILTQFFPFMKYYTAGDQAVCPICTPYAGLIMKRDDPGWSTIYPPNHHRCRCQVLEISAFEAVQPEVYPATAPGPARGFDRPPGNGKVLAIT